MKRIHHLMKLKLFQSKKLLLNATNWLLLEELFGENTDAWAGRSVELYTAKVGFRGKQVDAIRIRRAPETSESGADDTGGLDDVHLA